MTDANVWIDLYNADLLDAAFTLDVTWMSPDIIVRDEILTVDRTLLVDLGLEERTLSGAELNQVVALNARYPRPSPKDLTVLVVAQSEDGIVVTGDGPLRAAVETEGLEVHGVLWVLDRLVEREITLPNRAATSLETMVQQGSRLPERAVRQRLRQWRRT